MRMGENPSASNHVTARGIARLAAFMANKGSFDGKTLMPENLWEEFHSDAVVEHEWPWGHTSSFTKGGACKFGLDGIKGH